MAGGGDNAATPCKRPPNVRAGIDFPIRKTATLLKNHTSGAGPQFAEYAAVYFAASIEYLAAEVRFLISNFHKMFTRFWKMIVETVVDITPEEISQELVSDWQGMVSFYGGVGLKLGWLEDHVRGYGNWLITSGVDVDQLKGKITSKEYELEQKRREVSALESKLQELCAELDMAHLSLNSASLSFMNS